MIRLGIAAAFAAVSLGIGAAGAQMPPPPNLLGPNAAVATPPTTDAQPYLAQNAPTPLKAGAPVNETDAKRRLEAQGYTAIRNLKQDNRKNWHAKAQKDGKAMDVSVDTTGTIRARDQ